MIIAIAALIAIGAIAFILTVRAKDLPEPEPVSPFQHLDERKAAIYENLRDLQFEYRVGKLSDVDYAKTKLALQKELALVVAETERMLGTSAAAPAKPAPVVAKKQQAAFTCRHCGAEFAMALKFCGECGKEMS